MFVLEKACDAHVVANPATGVDTVIETAAEIEIADRANDGLQGLPQDFIGIFKMRKRLFAAISILIFAGSDKFHAAIFFHAAIYIDFVTVSAPEAASDTHGIVIPPAVVDAAIITARFIEIANPVNDGLQGFAQNFLWFFKIRKRLLAAISSFGSSAIIQPCANPRQDQQAPKNNCRTHKKEARMENQQVNQQTKRNQEARHFLIQPEYSGKQEG
jgi:hypothetical protein